MKIAIRSSNHEVEALMPSGCGAFGCGVAVTTNKRVRFTSKRSHFPSDLSCEQSPNYHGPTDEHETHGRSVAILVARVSLPGLAMWPQMLPLKLMSEIGTSFWRFVPREYHTWTMECLINAMLRTSCTTRWEERCRLA